jgi:uncharacterized protein (DUF2267 family)
MQPASAQTTGDYQELPASLPAQRVSSTIAWRIKDGFACAPAAVAWVIPRRRENADSPGRIAAEALLEGRSEASYGAEAAMDVVRHHVSTGEFEQVLRMLPAGVRAVVRK